MKLVQGGVCAAKGFTAAGINCGLKKRKPDLALIFSETPCIAAGVFTKNIVKAAPVEISKKRIGKPIRAILANSGNANCCAGEKGLKAALGESQAVAALLGIKSDSVLLASTGIIGKPLQVEKIKKAIPKLVSSLSKSGNKSARIAIMTTDTFPKEIAVSLDLNGKKVTIGGMVKGAGMIHPDMATMLSFVTTDVKIEKSALQKALKNAVSGSFNSISVDGDTSTNDSVMLVANGMAGNRLLRQGDAPYNKFCGALDFVLAELSKLIIRDGEGATKFVTIKVTGAKSDSDARELARFISTSSLLKCALFGEDPNWGRIAAKAGSAGISFKMDALDIYLGDIKVLSKGQAINIDSKKLKDLFKKKEIDITVNIGIGTGEAVCYTADLSYEYVKINAEYE